MSRKYQTPEGCTSISIGGVSYEAKKGIVTVPDEANHADMLSHEFTLAPGQDEPQDTTI